MNSIFFPHTSQGVFKLSLYSFSHLSEQNEPSSLKSVRQNLQKPSSQSNIPSSSSTYELTSTNSGESCAWNDNLQPQPASSNARSSTFILRRRSHIGTELSKFQWKRGLVSDHIGTSSVPCMLA